MTHSQLDHEDWTMDVMHLRVFQRQVLLQCQFLLIAADAINTALAARDTTRTFSALQALLNVAANISKALWGKGGTLAEERLVLRQSIGIQDDSPFKVVGVRNAFEHMDERIDRWWEQSESHNHVDLMIGPRKAISGIEEIDRFRAFDPETTDVMFWGEDFNVQVLVKETEQILPKLQVEASRPHWDTGSSRLS